MKKVLALILSLAVILVPITGGLASGSPDGEPVTLQVFFTGGFSTHPNGIQTDMVVSKLQEATGTILDFLPDTSDDVLLPRLASGDLPDLTFISDLKLIQNIIVGGLATQLDEYMDEYGGDILINAPGKVDFARKYYSNGTGNLYGIMGASGPIGKPTYYVFGPHIRWDLYKQLGYPEINSYMDFLPLLQSMLELEPTNADGRRNYGISFNTDWDSTVPLAIMLLTPMYGVSLEHPFHAEIDNANGYAVNNMFAEDSWAFKAAEFYFEANQMGLLDPESITQKWDSVSDKLLTGRCLFQLVNWPVGGFNNEMKNQGKNDVGFMPLYPKDSTLLWDWVGDAIGTGGMWVISSKCKTPEKALAVINYLNTVEGSASIYSGFEGVHWDMVDGEPVAKADIRIKLRVDEEYKEQQGINKYFNMAGLTAGTAMPGTDGIGIGAHLWPSSFMADASQLDLEYLEYYGVGRPSDAYELQRTKDVTDDLYGPYMEPMPDDIALISQRISDMANTEFYRLFFANDRAEFDAVKAEIIQKAYDLGYQQELDWVISARETAKVEYEASN